MISFPVCVSAFMSVQVYVCAAGVGCEARGQLLLSLLRHQLRPLPHPKVSYWYRTCNYARLAGWLQAPIF